jgi:hypothetical protein
MGEGKFPPGFEDALEFSLIEALIGRRARRFLLGASISKGAFAFKSHREPLPLTELERMMILLCTAGTTGWNFLIPYNERYAPSLPNYAGAAGGRTFPSSAGFHTSEIFLPMIRAFTSSELVMPLRWLKGKRGHMILTPFWMPIAVEFGNWQMAGFTFQPVTRT